MQVTHTTSGWNTPQGQTILGLLGCVIAGSVFVAGGVPAVIILVLVLLVPPQILILGFVCVSYFRLPEAYTFLLPLKLPLVLGVASMASVIITIVRTPEPVPRGRIMWLTAGMIACVGTGVVLAIMGPVTSFYAPRIPIAIAMILASGALYCWYRAFDKMNKTPWTIEIPLVIAFFAVVTVGVAFAQNPATALNMWMQNFWKIAIITLLLAWLLRSANDFRIALCMLIGSGVLVALRTLYNWRQGIDLVEGTRVTIGRTLFSTPEQIENAIPGQIIPGGSQLGDPNDLSLVLLYPIGMTLAVIVKLGLKTWIGKFCLVALPLLIIAIVATQSRGGALGVAAVFATVGLFYIRSKILIGALTAVGIIGLVLVMDIGGRQSGGLAELQSQGIDSSAMERLYAWSAAISMAIHHPLTGVGLDNFGGEFRAHTPVWPDRNMAAHSTWFGVLAETGIPGMALLAAIILALLRSLQRTWTILKTHQADPVLATFCIGLLAGLVGFCASGTFLSQGFRWPLYLQIGFTAALGVVVLQLQTTRSSQRTDLTK